MKDEFFNLDDTNIKNEIDKRKREDVQKYLNLKKEIIENPKSHIVRRKNIREWLDYFWLRACIFTSKLIMRKPR
jgi:hypothetical protein